MIRILQITDLHFGYNGEKPYGVNVEKKFDDIVDKIKKTDFQLLVITGDICFRQPHLEAFQLLKNKLECIIEKCLIIPGNHDNNQMIRQTFSNIKSCDNHYIYFTKTIEDNKFIFLDSSSGEIDEKQLNWFKNEIESGPEIQHIFMHHPPCLANVKYMDNKWRFLQTEKFQTLLFSYPKTFKIFCGHYHVERTISKRNMEIYITPSIFFNLNPDNPEFEIANYLNGFREIVISGNKLITNVQLVDS